jgi:hypothetical protein
MKTREPISIYEEALAAGKRAINAAAAKTGESAATTRDLDILFYGMACFDPLDDRAGYRVLFPNGLEESDGIPVHAASIWVRDREEVATARWPWFAWRNDYFLAEKRLLTITGLTPTALDASGFEGHVTNLQECDPSFQVSTTPDTVIEMVVDHGTLTSHVVNAEGMIVVRWRVKVEAGTPVRFEFGNYFVEIPPSVTQVFLANAGASSDALDINLRHFRLYRKLSTEPAKELPFQGPKTTPQSLGSLVLKDPTFGYITLLTPDVVCSAVQSRLSTSQASKTPVPK